MGACHGMTKMDQKQKRRCCHRRFILANLAILSSSRTWLWRENRPPHRQSNPQGSPRPSRRLGNSLTATAGYRNRLYPIAALCHLWCLPGGEPDVYSRRLGPPIGRCSLSRRPKLFQAGHDSPGPGGPGPGVTASGPVPTSYPEGDGADNPGRRDC